jgi:glyoxylase-like metal-dependent hydrolase (beta-lactamase superfamily II)
MTLQIQAFTLGPIQNNTYLIYDDETKHALVVDPALEPAPLAEFINQHSLILLKVLITHAHFDHYYGLQFLQNSFPTLKDVYLHPDDLDLWRAGGSARQFFGKNLDIAEPNQIFTTMDDIFLDDHVFQIRSVPGHTAGSVLFYSNELKSAFCGDAIFYHGIGRTDLPGGDFDTLIQSIRNQVFTLPDETRLFPGHGPATTVIEEKENNPFLH